MRLNFKITGGNESFDRRLEELMLDYRDSIKNVCEVHNTVISKNQMNEINDALNALITDYVVNDGIDEAEADEIISEDFWDYIREYI